MPQNLNLSKNGSHIAHTIKKAQILTLQFLKKKYIKGLKQKSETIPKAYKCINYNNQLGHSKWEAYDL